MGPSRVARLVAGALLRRRLADELRRCPACRSRFTCPLEWEPCDETHWVLEMRCGECGHSYEATMSDERAYRFDHELDRDVYEIRRAVERLDRERMELEVEAFAAALGRGLIDAADFAG